MPSLARAFKRRPVGPPDGSDFGDELDGLDNDNLPDPEAGADAGAGSSVSSVVSAGHVAAPQLPKRQDYVSDSDYSKYYSMLGQSPQPQEPGRGSKILSVLSDLFLHQDIPGQMRQGEQQRAEQRYEAQMAPVKARIDTGLGAYKSDVEAADKQASIDRQTAGENYYNTRGPTRLAPHYYPGKNDAGEPTEMQIDPNLEGAKPTAVGPRYEAPHNPAGPGNVDEQTFSYLTSPAPKGKGLSADAAYEWIQKQKGMTGTKVGQGQERINQGGERIDETKKAHTDLEHSRAHTQATKEVLAHQLDYDNEDQVAEAIDKRYQEILQQVSGDQGGQNGAPPPGSKVRVYNRDTGKLE